LGNGTRRPWFCETKDGGKGQEKLKDSTENFIEKSPQTTKVNFTQ